MLTSFFADEFYWELFARTTFWSLTIARQVENAGTCHVSINSYLNTIYSLSLKAYVALILRNEWYPTRITKQWKSIWRNTCEYGVYLRAGLETLYIFIHLWRNVREYENRSRDFCAFMGQNCELRIEKNGEYVSE